MSRKHTCRHCFHYVVRQYKSVHAPWLSTDESLTLADRKRCIYSNDGEHKVPAVELARCNGCGSTFRGERGLIAHQSQRFVSVACRRVKPARPVEVAPAPAAPASSVGTWRCDGCGNSLPATASESAIVLQCWKGSPRKVCGTYRFVPPPARPEPALDMDAAPPLARLLHLAATHVGAKVTPAGLGYEAGTQLQGFHVHFGPNDHFMVSWGMPESRSGSAGEVTVFNDGKRTHAYAAACVMAGTTVGIGS